MQKRRVRRRWCARVQSCGPAVWFPGSCVCVCLLAALQLPLLHSSNDSQRRCQRTASLLLSLSLFSSSSRCCCAGPSLVGDSSLSFCHATPPAFPTGRWGRRERERERVGNNPSSDSWICEPFADAAGLFS